LMRALAANEKVSRFGIRELERILDEMLANQMLQAKDQGAREVVLEANEAGEVVVVPSG
jgi:hypothetical protein